MNKPELIAAMAQKTGHTRMECGEVVNGFFEVIADALAHGEGVEMIGFGAFGTTDTKARTICHPETGCVIQLSAGKRPKFTAGSMLKAAANKAI